MLAAAALKTGLDAAGIAGPLRGYGTFAIFPLFGLLAGLLSSDPARTVLHRGAVIQDGGPAQRRGRGGELTLAGIPIPPTGRNQALQDGRHHRHRQVDGDPRTARGRTRPRRPRGDRRPRRRVPRALLRCEPRRRDPQPLRPTRPHLEHLRRADREPRRRATRTFADPGPRRARTRAGAATRARSSPPSRDRRTKPASAT